MAGTRPVVVGTDGSPHADHAVRWAVHFAALHKVPLRIVTAVSAPVAYGMGVLPQDFFSDLEESGQNIVRSAAAIATETAPTVPVEAVVIHDATGPALLEMAEHASTIVVGARGLGTVASAFLGSVSSQVVRHAECPVVIVHAPTEDAPPSASGPVVVGVDGSDNCAPAVAAAMKEAALRDTTLVAVHAWSDVPIVSYPMIDMHSHYDEAVVSEAVLSEHLAGYCSEYPDVPVERVVVMDQPDAALVERSVGAQLVVVGSRGRGGFAGMLLGSTSAKVIRSAHCPVMVVRN